jgi:uncharacterized FlaG/YvyC family protein
MPRSLEEILKPLSDEESGVVRAAIQAEKDRGVEASRKKGQEVEKLLTEVNKFKDFLRDDMEFDLDKDLKEQLEAAEAAAAQGGEGDSKKASDLEKQVKTLTKQVETLTTQLTEKEKIANEKSDRLRVTKLTEILRKSIGEKVHSSDFVIKGLIRDGTVKFADENEDTAVFILNGTEMPFDKGVQDFLKGNPGIVKNEQAGGGGSGGDHGAPGEKVMKRSDFDKLSASERSAKARDGWKLTD